MDVRRSKSSAIFLIVTLLAMLGVVMFAGMAWAKGGDGQGGGDHSQTTSGYYQNHIDVKYAAAVTDNAENQAVTAIANNTVYCTFNGETYSQTVQQNSNNQEFEHSGSSSIPSSGIPNSAVITFIATVGGETYNVELDSSDKYPAKTKYKGANDSKIGTYFGMSADAQGYYDISDKSVFLISQIVCNGSSVSKNSVSGGGLDLVLNTATIIENATNVIQGTKTLNGADLEASQFSFILKRTDVNWETLTGASAYSATVANAADGSFAFPAISYTQNGSYYYTVEEVAGDAEGYTYDSAVYYVTHCVDLQNASSPVTQTIEKSGSDDGSQPATSIAFVNSYASPTVNVSGTKMWDDADDQDGKRPASITVNLLANGTKVKSATVTAEGNWSYSFTDLPKYAGGELISYTVTEEPVEGYAATYSGSNITNRYTPETTSVSVVKAWADAGDQDGKRPASITVNLLANGTKVKSATIRADETGRWAYTFTDLPKYAGGEPISYTVTEEAVEGYTTSVDGYSITNTHTPETTSVSGTKTWDDADDQDGIRPDSVELYLVKNGTVTSISATATAEGEWKYSFTDLPKYENGELVIYAVTDYVEGYDTTLGTVDNDYAVTNTHEPETTVVSGVKVWDDVDDQDGIRPESITVNLCVDDEVVRSVEVTAEDNWAFKFEGLPMYAAGEPIVYTVSEDEVEGYAAEVKGNTEDGFIIVNAHTPEPELVPDEPASSDDGKQVLAKTGDTAPYALAGIGTLAVAAAAVGAVARRKLS